MTWNPLLTAPAHPRGAPLTYGIDQPLNVSHDFWVNGTSYINISPVWEHSEKRTSDLTAVQNFL